MHKIIHRLNSIYLDYQATTPLDPRVLNKMMPYFTTYYANPHSNHPMGKQVAQGITTARNQIAQLINSQDQDIIFTSGATESNNHAIKGVAELFKSQPKKHMITVKTEHKCVLESFKYLQGRGYEITYLPVNSNGLVDIQQLINSIKLLG